jgi:hypothetical protein
MSDTRTDLGAHLQAEFAGAWADRLADLTASAFAWHVACDCGPDAAVAHALARLLADARSLYQLEREWEGLGCVAPTAGGDEAALREAALGYAASAGAPADVVPLLAAAERLRQPYLAWAGGEWEWHS